MPEPTQLTPEEITALQTEVEKLRSTNADLVARHGKDKTRLAELEAQGTALTGKLTESEARIKTLTVNVPLRQIAEKVSDMPDTWMELFGQSFKVEAAQDGKLTILTADGQPAKNSKGENVPFDFVSVAHFVTQHEPESERAKLFNRITRTNFASGSASIQSQGKARAPARRIQKFGLR